MNAVARLYDRCIAMPYNLALASLDEQGIDTTFPAPLTAALDWLIGDQTLWPYRNHRWPVDELAMRTSGADAAPICKLASAIIGQAIMDSATRIDIYANAPEPERVGPEKPPEMIAKEEEEAWDRAMNAQNPQRSANFAKFARILAEAAVKQGAVEVPRGDRLQVVYTIATLRMEAMRIPSNLSERLVRIYQYDFNYQRCASYVRPINLLYCEVRGRGAYASIDQYDPADDHKVGIVLEYES